jgi:L-seryl-tRNA(Ser) seleniumtransferase
MKNTKKNLSGWKQIALREIPAIEELLQLPEINALVVSFPRSVVTDSVRNVLAGIRENIISSEVQSEAEKVIPGNAIIISKIKIAVHNKMQSEFRKAINGTGIVLNTSLGRAVLPDEALKAFNSALSGYTRLAVDLKTGKRKSRDTIIEGLLCEITGAESATIANNNAAATILILSTLFKGKEVICSRGQMVEIGGSFRIPEIMEASGAKLVGVGTTNRTHLKDYEKAITKQTGAILRVHSSNYKIVGFASDVPVGEIVKLAHKRKLLAIDDLGSGALVDLVSYGFADEPLVLDSVKAGADVISFSGDKLLGGPQCGIILGKKKYIDLIRKNPLARAFRVGKLTLVALEATLKLFRNKETVLKINPTLRMLTMDLKTIENRAVLLKNKILESVDNVEVNIIDEFSQPGSGSLAGYNIPTKVVTVKAKLMPTQELAEKLRARDIPIFTRIKSDKILIDLRTIFEGEEEEIARAFSAYGGSASGGNDSL